MMHRTKESYKHRSAKAILRNWLSKDFTAHTEVNFVDFVPDVVTYENNHIQAFYEVVHTSDISGKKIGAMQYFCYVNNLDIFLHVVDAEYILKQCDPPEKIEKLSCKLI